MAEPTRAAPVLFSGGRVGHRILWPAFRFSDTYFVGQVGNLRPIGNRPSNNFLAKHQADYQSAAGYQPALHDQKQL